MLNSEVKKGLKESISCELSQFLDRIADLYQDSGHASDWKRSIAYDTLLSSLLPVPENNSTAEESLSEFLKSTINNELEKRRKKFYCSKELNDVSCNSNIFGSTGRPLTDTLNFDQSFSNKNSFVGHRSDTCNFSEFQSFVPSIISSEYRAEKESDFVVKNGDGISPSTEGAKRRYKLYSGQIKNQAIMYGMNNGVRRASQKYKIPSCKINTWLKSVCKDKLTRGRKPIDPSMEEKVCQWLKEQIQKDTYITQKIIRDKAKELSRSKQFKASKGWLEKFFKRRPKLFEDYSQNRNKTFDSHAEVWDQPKEKCEEGFMKKEQLEESEFELFEDQEEEIRLKLQPSQEEFV